MDDDLLGDVMAFVRRYVVLPEGTALPVAAWALHTHVVDVFAVAPYLFITSPTKRCGKTLLMELLAGIVCRPMLASNISEAALFRAVDQLRPTLLIDEAQVLRDRTERSAALHDLLCAGHRRGQAAVRIVGRGAEMAVASFNVFGPKAIALIGRPTEVLLDRGIEIRMHRRAPHEKVERFRLARVQVEGAELRARIEEWAAAHREDVARAYEATEPPEMLNDRASDNWAPLFAVVAVAAPARLLELERAARILSGGDRVEEESLAVRLLGDARRIFYQRGEDRIASADLVEALNAEEEAPWRTYRRTGLTQHELAKLLRPFDIRPVTVWLSGGRTAKGYKREDFEGVWTRYLSPNPSGPSEVNADAASRTLLGLSGTLLLTERGIAQQPPQKPILTDLTDLAPNREASRQLQALGDLLETVPAGEEVTVRLRTFGLARERGFPRVEIRSGEFVGPGQAAWTLFVARATLEQLAAAARALQGM